MTADSVPQSLNVRCAACRNRFPAEAPAWGRTVPCPTCGAPCDVPVPLGVDIAPQWMSAEEKQKAAAAHRPEPVLDVGLKADSSDGIPTGRSQPMSTSAESAASASGAGIVWAETGSTRPAGGRSARDSTRAPASDIDENDLLDDEDDDDLLSEIKAGARQSKYAPRARVRRERRDRRDPALAQADTLQREYQRHREVIQKPNREQTLWSWFLGIGALLMLGSVVVVLASLLRDQVVTVGDSWYLMRRVSVFVFLLGGYLVFKGMIHG